MDSLSLEIHAEGASWSDIIMAVREIDRYLSRGSTGAVGHTESRWWRFSVVKIPDGTKIDAWHAVLNRKEAP